MKLHLYEGMGRSARRVRGPLGAALLAVSLALGLPGCGPGTGGTGNGIGMNFQGSWSAIPIASDNSHTAAAGCASLTPAPCTTSGPVLELGAAGITLRDRCWAFASDAGWTDPTGATPSRVSGQYTAPGASGGVSSQTATLLIELRDPQLVLTVTDASGQVLQGPMVLSRTIGTTGAASGFGGCAGG